MEKANRHAGFVMESKKRYQIVDNWLTCVGFSLTSMSSVGSDRYLTVRFPEKCGVMLPNEHLLRNGVVC